MTKKPLELTIFPPVPEQPRSTGPGMIEAFRVLAASTKWNVDRLQERALSRSKRLTEPELAAEYWQADYADVRCDREDEDLEPIPEIILRFGTHPHFDEEPT